MAIFYHISIIFFGHAQNGVIGSVNFKPGEKVSPFDPILTLHTQSPAYVKGYIYENVYSRIALNDNVEIMSMAKQNATATGKVVGVGSRIVEYPIRLRKRPEIQMWGREIQILIPQDNQFVLGEKLIISKKGGGSDENYYGFSIIDLIRGFPFKGRTDINDTISFQRNS